MKNKISDKDKKDWKNFVSNNDRLPDKDLIEQDKSLSKTKLIDLHGYTLEQANEKIEEFIFKAFDEKVNKLIVVTGKGLHSQTEKDPYVSRKLSILKYSIPEFIENNKNLMNIINNIKDADIKDGGNGAFYIFLKKNRSIK